MEIRIDTSRDSKDDIRKAIQFLKGIVGDAQDAPSLSSASFSEGTASALGSMFGDDPPAPSTSNSDSVPKASPDKITIIPY